MTVCRGRRGLWDPENEARTVGDVHGLESVNVSPDLAVENQTNHLRRAGKTLSDHPLQNRNSRVCRDVVKPDTFRSLVGRGDLDSHFVSYRLWQNA
jgi:hypothetical protein